VLPALVQLPISEFLPSDLFVLSGCFLECFFKFLVGKLLFFANFKLATLFPIYPPPAATKNPNPVALTAIVPVRTGSNLCLKSISFSTN